MPDLLHSELETAKRHIGESEFLTDIAARAPAGMLEEVVARHGRYLEPVEGGVICAKGEYGSEVYFLLGGAAWIVTSEDFATDFIRTEKGGVRRIPERQMTKLITERLEGERGMFFGEVGAATRAPYGATIFASANARLIALNWRGLRTLMQISPIFSAAINERCRRYAASSMLSQHSIKRALSRSALREFADTARFEIIQGSIDAPALVAAEGEYTESLYLVQNGFGRISQMMGWRRVYTGFVGRGDLFGLLPIAAAFDEQHTAVMRRTLHAISDMSVLRFPAAAVEKYLLPALSKERLQQLDPYNVVESEEEFSQENGKRRQQESEAVGFFTERLFINGRRAMVIDHQRCVGCDECARACADTHNGVARFVRTGPSFNGYAVANACMHCTNPPCLSDCPTGAIHRQSGGEVIIDEALCVGCGTCARSCPYDNITMFNFAGENDNNKSEGENKTDDKAVKCDLCAGRRTGPACVRACPHDAIARVDLSDRNVLSQLARGVPLRELRD